MTDPIYQDYQLRVIKEKKDLDDKRRKLKYFIQNSTKFAQVPTDEQDRMKRQLKVMDEYSAILEERINAWSAH